MLPSLSVCPPQWRGRMTGFYNCGWFGGSIPAAGITLGTRSIPNDWCWRIPLILQAAPSLVVICTVFFLPESPRWYVSPQSQYARCRSGPYSLSLASTRLMAQGRDEEALAFLTRFHGSGHEDDPVVQLEYLEFKEHIAIDGSDKRWWDYSELVNTSSARWRILMVALMGIFGQFSGNGLGYFNLDIYKAVGYASPSTTRIFGPG